MASPATGSAAIARADEREYRVLTTGCGFVDRSERGKLALTGPDAKRFLNSQLTNDIEALEPGTGCYAALLTHKGKMLADVRVLDTGEEVLLDTERLSLQTLFDAIRRYKIGYTLDLHKRTLERGLLSLEGPAAREVVGAAEVPDREHANRPWEIAGEPVLLVATDAGLDVICDSAHTGELHAALDLTGAVPVPESAAEVLRIERGRPRYGIDLDDTVIPQEAGLNERAVSFTKGCYVGQETVARLYYKGKPNRHLRGLRMSEAAPPGTPLRLAGGDGREVGALGSVGVSPRLGPIGLALVRREASPGDTLAVGEGGATAEVIELPF